MSSLLTSATTLLFVPGNRRDRFTTALRSGADLVVVDLEDAVASESKADARDSTRTLLESGAQVAVRVNAVGTEWHAADIEMAAGLATAVVLPKAEAGPALAGLAHSLYSAGTALLALVETAAGVLDARAIGNTSGVERLAIGTFDLAAELGMDPADHESFAAVRSSIALASAAAGVAAPIDGVFPAFNDHIGLSAETARARRLGYTGKFCIHPRQVSTVAAGLAPTAEQIAWAHSMLDGLHHSDGVLARNGSMVDKPVIDRARRIVNVSDRSVEDGSVPPSST